MVTLDVVTMPTEVSKIMAPENVGSVDAWMRYPVALADTVQVAVANVVMPVDKSAGVTNVNAPGNPLGVSKFMGALDAKVLPPGPVAVTRQ